MPKGEAVKEMAPQNWGRGGDLSILYLLFVCNRDFGVNQAASVDNSLRL